jgi:hypothetical protein
MFGEILNYKIHVASEGATGASANMDDGWEQKNFQVLKC